MKFPKRVARVTGLIGVIVLISGSFTHSINSKLIVPSDAIRTAKNFITSESLFRLGFVSSLIMETVFIFYAFGLYRLLKPVNKKHAMLMLILALVPVPLFMLNQLNQYVAFLHATDNIEQMLFFLNVHKHGGFIVSIFFGLWLFPLGYLVYTSTYIPKLLGVFLMIGSFGYILHFFQGFLITNYESSLWSNPVLVVTHIAELLLMCWLLIKGVHSEKWKAVSAA